MLDAREKAGVGNKKEADQTETHNGPSLTTPPAISLPKGGGAIRGMGEKFAANPVTGTSSMSVPIATSPGRSGFGPQLSLSYDSGAGNGLFGFGWNLSPLPSITRKTDKGLPRYQDTNNSDVFILSNSEDLVPEYKKGAMPDSWATNGNGTFVLDEVLSNGYLVRRYRPRIEEVFARIERWTSQIDSTDVFWRSISKENVTTYYGKTQESRITDPTDKRKIFSWKICESYDAKGNAILYEYVAENSDAVDVSANEKNRSRTAQRYLKRIKYCNKTPRRPNENLSQRTDWLFEVVFDYGEHDPDDPKPNDNEELDQNGERKNKWRLCRHDPFSNYRSGFEVRTHRLCQRVLMFHHFPEEDIGGNCLVKSTDIIYRDTRDNGNDGAAFIASVSQNGYKRRAGGGYLKKSLPPLEFAYSESLINENVQEVDHESIENLPLGLDGSNYQWVDLDGEGLSGILTEQSGTWFYKRNLSALPVADGNGKPKVAAHFAPIERLPTIPSPANLTNGQQLLDLTGDGQLDVVQFDGPLPGFCERTADEGWEPFRSFASLPNLTWKDSNLKFVDLTGDGHADILITGDEVLTWYPSLAEEGFGSAEKVRQALDEETGPRLVFADGAESIYLADFSGDGLTDLVRIRNGEVCYWPNLGYGRFGAKVTMDDAPKFDSTDQFDQKRIRLADIDGSGLVDIIYVAADGVRLYFNQSGNSWSKPRLLANFPATDNLSSIQVTDLLGNGTACLVWSSPLPGNAVRPMRYIDLMGGQKPHLLIKTLNNLGAETEVSYAPSTRFYLADKYAGRPWITKAPFPVHCVERVTVTDKWRNTRFSSTYSYHHAYFDGVEREFRGFGRVEQVDVESFGTFAAGNAASPYITGDKTLYQPPIKTITWFHTGAAIDRQRILTQLNDEYFPNSLAALPGYSPLLTGFEEKLLPEPDVEVQQFSADEWRESQRACKGMMLRQEIYELDVDQLEAGRQVPVRLFSAATHNCHIRRVQPTGQNQHAVFLVTESEALNYNYELDLRPVTFPPDATNILPLEPDPRVTHTLNLSFDEYGNIQQSIAVGYKRFRAFADPDLPEHLALIQDVQSEQNLAYTETLYTGDAVEPQTGTAEIQHYRLRLPCEVQTYELTGFVLRPGALYFDLADFRDYHLSDTLPDQGAKQIGKLEHHQHQSTNAIEKRKVEHVVTLFFSHDLKTPLDLGELNHLALTYETYKLALTKPLLQAVLGSKFDNTIESAIDTPSVSGYWSGANLLGAASADQWWMRSGIAGFAVNAAEHFYLPERYIDPFGNETAATFFGKYDLFIESTRDALGNHTRVFIDPQIGMRFDYRVLAPTEIEDSNSNRTEVYFDALGMVVAVAIKGKGGEADNLNGYTDVLANPNPGEVLAHFSLPSLSTVEVRDRFSLVLGNATARFLYHLGERVENGKTVWCDRPSGSCTIVREQHVADVEELRLTDPDAKSPLQIAFECTDGHGVVMMRRSQAEPEQSNGPLQWIVSGKTILNNKGKPVKEYEPYFSARPVCCADGDGHEEIGVTPAMYYDAAGRLIRTEMPDGAFSRVEFSPWHVKNFDANDTVGRFARVENPAVHFEFSAGSTWYSSRNPRVPEQALPRDPITNELTVTPDQQAAWLAAQHADTPSLTILDSLGREVIAIAHNRVEDADGPYLLGGKHYHDERYLTFTRLNAEGKPLWIRDARQNLVVQYITPPKLNNDPSGVMPVNAVPCYDIAGNLLYQHSMDAGDRWMLNDAAGKPMFAWDFNQRQNNNNAFIDEHRFYTTVYDALHRPIEKWLTVNDDQPQMVERFEYVDTDDVTPFVNIADARSRNLCGQLHRHHDPSGLIQIERLDFQGNPLEVQRRLVSDHSTLITDWQTNQDSKLEAEAFSQITEYDALKRMTRLYNWHRGVGSRVAIYEPRYNERGLLQSEQLVVQAVRNSQTSGKRYDEVAGITQRHEAIKEIRHDAKGQRQLLKLGNGAITHYDYDPLTFRLRQLRTTRLTGGEVDPAFPSFASNLTDVRVLQQLHYTYDAVGNITEIYDEAYEPVFFKNQEVRPRSRYVYDALYRLVEASGREGFQPANAPTPNEPAPQGVAFAVTNKTLRNYVQRYTYDAVGNIMRMRHTADQGNWHRRYDYAPDSNRLLHTWEGDDDWTSSSATNKTTYHYDTHGNMRNLLEVADESFLGWDHRDMIASINLGGGGTAFYQYDANKQRTRKVLARGGGIVEKRIYLGGLEIYRRTINGVLVEEIESLHLFDGQQRLLMVDQVLATDRTELGVRNLYRYILSNHLGSATVELDENAQIISYEEYYPYGTTAYQAGRNAVEVKLKRYRYTGMERDEETGLNYHTARYYLPFLARWLSCDPAGLLDSPNVYAYVSDNPISGSDSSGYADDEKKLPRVVPEEGGGYTDVNPNDPKNYMSFREFVAGAEGPWTMEGLVNVWNEATQENGEYVPPPNVQGDVLGPGFPAGPSGPFPYWTNISLGIVNWSVGGVTNLVSTIGNAALGGFSYPFQVVEDLVGRTNYESAMFSLTMATMGMSTFLIRLPRLSAAARMDAAVEEVALEQLNARQSRIGAVISKQSQAPHIKDTPQWIAEGKKSYFTRREDAQNVLNEFRRGADDIADLGAIDILEEDRARGQIFFQLRRGNAGFNNNLPAGFVDQPTDIFMLKGVRNPSIVPLSPMWLPKSWKF